MFTTHPDNPWAVQMRAASGAEIPSLAHTFGAPGCETKSDVSEEEADTALRTLFADRVDMVRLATLLSAPPHMQKLLPERDPMAPLWAEEGPEQVRSSAEAHGPWVLPAWEDNWRAWVMRNYSDLTLAAITSGGGNVGELLFRAARSWVQDTCSLPTMPNDQDVMDEVEAKKRAMMETSDVLPTGPAITPLIDDWDP